ncbi:Alpha/Beta hydrolase protein [Madurella fahalii]|uniref:Alpha/Beta hydrolase protein n=1 Tax=Madurella fahalii TaxID=1157608 RepID=A0ABQ0GG82_9PEZI
MASLGWVFTPYPPFPATLFPNIALWNVSNAAKNLTYQIGVSWPFEWESREAANKSALTMYVIDGNALGMTASEGFKRRKPVDPPQPDSVVVSIGYPLTDSVYDFTRRSIDFRPPLPEPQDPPSGADDFIDFLDGVLRPWVRSTVFPNVAFTRDALYGHSFGGLFVIYALITHPELFDTFISASAAINWNNGSILDDVYRIDTPSPLLRRSPGCYSENSTESRPALFIGYGSLEQFPVKRRTETEAAFQRRKSLFQTFRVTEYCYELYHRVRASGRTRDVVLKEYIGQDHAGVGGSALTDGIDYFVDW